MFNYLWYIKDGYPYKGIDRHGLKVYSTFACGGGSSMGYKLAGYDVIGANDIDPQMAKVYKENHHPKYYDLCPIGNLLEKELPDDYYKLDILDGSPPCSTFSIAGQREKGWKKNKVFREGQSKQILSDLFFDWIKLVAKLQPKVAIAENVKGMLFGNAKAYTRSIINEIDKIGYDVQLFQLNSATMGVPQRRERVFFICKRKDLKLPKVNLRFDEQLIEFKKIKYNQQSKSRKVSKEELRIWNLRKPKDTSLADTKKRLGEKNNRFTTKYEKENKVLDTITASDNNILYEEPRKLNDIEYRLASSFPLDYNFMDIETRYLVGMSVPPLMMAQVSYQVYLQLFKNTAE